MLTTRCAPLFGLLLILGAAPTQASQADESSMNRDRLEAELAERDAIIIELRRSVSDLEKRVAALERSLSDQPPQNEGPSPSQDNQANSGSRRSDAGRLAVDEIAAERALERTLVQAGALLLTQGAVEITPSVSMDVADLNAATVVDTGADDELGVLRVDRTSTSFGLTARVGLPWDSQLELAMPYVSVSEDAALSLLEGPVGDTNRTGSGAGDFVIGVSKTLMRENGLAPDLVGRLVWNTGGGTDSDNDVELGGGFSSLTGSLSVVKRLDPLAVFLTVEYQDSGRRDDIDLGDAIGATFGTGLAVSPGSSLSAAVTHRSFSKTRIGGEVVAGTELDITSLTLGFSTILRRGTLLNLFADVGMSEDAADYSLGFSVPVRMR